MAKVELKSLTIQELNTELANAEKQQALATHRNCGRLVGKTQELIFDEEKYSCYYFICDHPACRSFDVQSIWRELG